MWVFPLVAGIVALVFAAQLGGGFASGRRSRRSLWAVAMLMYSVASIAVALGALDGWTPLEFEIYWVLGAVLNVAFLAAGEIDLLSRNRSVLVVLWLLLIFVSAYALATTRTAQIDPPALLRDLPSGKEVFGDGTAAHRLPQLISIPSYLILVGGAAWSAWRMRGRPELRDQFTGTLWIAIGATVIAGVGSAFAATGNLPAFSLALLLGIGAMYWGFLRASGPRSQEVDPAGAAPTRDDRAPTRPTRTSAM